MYLGEEYGFDHAGDDAGGFGVIPTRETLLFPPADFLDDGSAGGGAATKTYKCPYCDEDGYSEIQLFNHVHDVHAADTKQVV